MGQAFTIQSFFIPIVRKVPNQSKYPLFVLIAYIAGGLAYYYIAYMGSIGIYIGTKVFGIVSIWEDQIK